VLVFLTTTFTRCVVEAAAGLRGLGSAFFSRRV
jgi:hypothetical protein